MTDQNKALFKEFETKFQSLNQPEEKVEACISFMREVLSQAGTPRLKDFWDAKNVCMQAFKEKMNPIKRKAYWEEYVELTTEAKRLKTILDEQSSFNLEQIELALDALKNDIDALSSAIEKVEPLTLSNNIRRLIKSPKYLIEQHAQLFVLNALSVRLNALRKEVIHTDMRIKHKNKLLKAISEYSDKVFPQRRELIKTLSDDFLLTIEAFAAGRMQESVPTFHLKDEIKKLQQLSKELSLSSPVFKKTRDILSGCWDIVKKKEKEFAEVNAKLAEEHDEAYKLLEPDCIAFSENPTTIQNGQALIAKVKAATLSKQGQRALTDLVQTGVHVLKQKEKEAEEKRKEEQKLQLDELMSSILSADSLTSERAKELELEMKALLDSMLVSEVERMRLDAMLYKMKAEILLKANAQEELHSFRKVLKEKLNEYRKGAGGSSLDFEKAMLYSELTDECRSLLDRIEAKS